MSELTIAILKEAVMGELKTQPLLGIQVVDVLALRFYGDVRLSENREPVWEAINQLLDSNVIAREKGSRVLFLSRVNK